MALSAERHFQPQTPDFAERTQALFARTQAMALIGAELVRVEPGDVEIHLPFREDLTQQHGFVHAGMLTTAVDTACGYAAFTLMPASAEVLTVEFKVNFLAPARGSLFVCRGRVIKAGRTITVCDGAVHALQDGQEKLVTTMSATIMTI